MLTLVGIDDYNKIKSNINVKNKQVFSSKNKYSAITTGTDASYYKGAPEKLIDKCTKYFDGNDAIDLNEDVRSTLSKAIKNMTENDMRCIALTFSE